MGREKERGAREAMQGLTVKTKGKLRGRMEN